MPRPCDSNLFEFFYQLRFQRPEIRRGFCLCTWRHWRRSIYKVTPGHGNGDSVWLLLKGVQGLSKAGRLEEDVRFEEDKEELVFIPCPMDRAAFVIGARGAVTGLPAPCMRTTELELEYGSCLIG